MSRKGGACHRWLLLVVGATLLSAVDPAVAQSPAERRGARLVRLYCTQCHAVDQVGESRLAIAPPFRTLRLRYPVVADLQRPLADGVHPIMPKFHSMQAGSRMSWPI